MGRRHGGIGSHGLLKERQRFGILSLRFEQVAQRQSRLDGRRIQARGLGELGRGALQLALQLQRHAEIVVGARVVGRQSDRAAVAFGRSRQIALRLQECAQVGMGSSVVRSNVNRRAIAGHGLGQLAQRALCFGQREVELGPRRVDVDRPYGAIDRRARVAARQRDPAQHPQRSRVARLERQHLAISPRRLLQVARAMPRHRVAKQLIDVRHTKCPRPTEGRPAIPSPAGRGLG